MRRIAGLILIAAGVALMALAVALPGYVYARVAKAPDNPDQDLIAEGTGITALVPSRVAGGGNAILLNQTVRVTRRIVGQIPPSGSRVPRGQAFYQLAFEARVVNPELSGNAGLLQAYLEGASFDGDSGEATNCCGDYLITRAGDSVGQAVIHDGLIFKFPFKVQRNHDYPFWDSNAQAAFPARYDGTEKILGMQTYRFVQAIDDEVIGRQDVPGAVFGRKDLPSVKADQVYATIRTVWVEPYTGAIIKGSEQVNQRLAFNGKEVPIIAGRLTYTGATVRANVHKFASSARGLRFVTRVGPIAGWTLGPILVLIGLTLLAFSHGDDDGDTDDNGDGNEEWRRQGPGGPAEADQADQADESRASRRSSTGA